IGWTFYLAFSPDGKRLAGVSSDDALGNCTLHIWQPATGKHLRRVQAPAATGMLAFSPDGKLLASAGADSTVYVWEASSGKSTTHLHVPNSQRSEKTLIAVAFSPDGKMLASEGMDGVVRLWELASGQERRRFRGHGHWVKDLVFSPDSKKLISASDDTTALVWDVTGLLPGEQLSTQ